MPDTVVFYIHSVGIQEEDPETEPTIMILLSWYVELSVLGEVPELLFLIFGVTFLVWAPLRSWEAHGFTEESGGPETHDGGCPSPQFSCFDRQDAFPIVVFHQHQFIIQFPQGPTQILLRRAEHARGHHDLQNV